MHKMKECMCLNKSPLQASMGNLHVILCCKVCVHEAVGPLSLLTHRYWEKENGWGTMYVWKSTKRSKLKCSLTSRRGRRINLLSDSLSLSLRDFFYKKMQPMLHLWHHWYPFWTSTSKHSGFQGVSWSSVISSLACFGTCSSVRLLVFTQLSSNSILNFHEHFMH